MSKENVEIEVHRAVEAAIENGISPRDFIKMVTIYWSEVYREKDEHAMMIYLERKEVINE